MIIKQFFKNKYNLTLFVIVVLQIVLMFQGFDVCDDGFVLTFYQQIFQNPESVEYNFLYWFSGFIGGLWYQMYEDGGIIWFRLLGVVLNTSTFIVSYKVLKNYAPKRSLLLALVMVLFVNDYGFLTFYHNQITAFFSVCIVFALHRGLVQANYKWLLLAGIIYFLNGLTRLPNFVFGLIFLAVPFYYYVNKLNFKLITKPISYIFIGGIIGALAVVFIQVSCGHLDVMVEALYTMMDVGKTEGSSHNFKILLLAQYFNIINIIVAFFQFAIVFLITVLLLRFTGYKSMLFNFILVCFGGFIVYWINLNVVFSVYALAYTACILLIFDKKNKPNLRVVAFMGFIMLATMTLGTAGGVKSSGYMAIWIGFPLFYFVLPTIIEVFFKVFASLNLKGNSLISNRIAVVLMLVMSIAFLGLKAYKMSNQAYFDKGTRLDKTYTINNKKARYIYTTERRANIVNNMLRNLNKYVKPGDYLFAYDHIPMVHFLTNTLPYTYNSWPGIYDSFSFEKKIKKAEQEIEELPVVLIQKFETIIEFSEPIPDYMIPEKNSEILHSAKSIQLMNNFLQRNNYQEVWDDDYFSIYKSIK